MYNPFYQNQKPPNQSTAMQLIASLGTNPNNSPAVMDYQRGYQENYTPSTYVNPVNVQWGGRESAKGEPIPYYNMENTINSLNSRYNMPANYRPNNNDMDYIKRSIEFTKWMNRNNYMLPSTLDDKNKNQLKEFT